MRNNYFLTLVLIVCVCSFVNEVNANYFMTRLKRRWFIAGEFSRVAQSDGSILDVNNFAAWDGKKWRDYGEGTNGPVTALFVDSCFNIYLAGSFTEVNGRKTGPIAVWHVWNNKWESLGHLENQTLNSVVNSISVNCYDTPTDNSRCACDVYIGGQFEYALNNDTSQIANNVAMYNTRRKRWNNLGGIHVHGINSMVRSVDFRNFGLTVVSRFGWFGGDGFLKRYMYDHGQHTWKSTQSIESSDVISSVYYDPNYFEPIDVLVSGMFAVNTTDGECRNLCIYDPMKDRWSSVAPELNTGYISRSIQLFDSIFITGDIRIQGENDTEISTSVAINTGGCWQSYGMNPNNFTIPDNVLSFTACSIYDLGCGENSMAIVAEGIDSNDGIVKFFNYEKGEWMDFGRGLNGSGTATLITSINYADNAGTVLFNFGTLLRTLICALSVLFFTVQ